MTDVLLFHHVLGLTGGVAAFADRLRGEGHRVTTPDLFDGVTFSTLDEGLAHADAIGFENVIDRGTALAESHPSGIVYAGFSMGALVAHKLAQTRPGALGALLYHHGDVPVDTFADVWPEGVDAQFHISEDDEFGDPKILAEFVDGVGAVAVSELFTYAGSTHLFTDAGLDGYDPVATELVIRRSLDFLERRG
ncbi:MAG: dienelactone hydrolase family protein [Actinobacteria bacterium]|nr:dienelactone hydrolase family protein [Actinomycetota bacterium]MCI0542928.1 dienelactone hydrolase family protein [Actinomycetota bacterium]MCI0678135.1 dienelactone hydrolase family protein [Actinomycetota bacterium]